MRAHFGRVAKRLGTTLEALEEQQKEKIRTGRLRPRSAAAQARCAGGGRETGPGGSHTGDGKEPAFKPTPRRSGGGSPLRWCWFDKHRGCTAMQKSQLRDFGREIAQRDRFTTPADSPLHDCSPYQELHARREILRICPSSRGHFLSRQTLSVTIRNLFIAVGWGGGAQVDAGAGGGAGHGRRAAQHAAVGVEYDNGH